MFKLFGRKSAPADAAAYLPPWLGQAREAEFPRSYEAQLREVYRTNPVGLRSVRLVAGAVEGLPLYGERDDALALVRTGGLLEKVAAGLLLHGNAFVRLIRDGEDRPAGLTTLRPERCAIEAGGDGRPLAIRFRGAAGATLTFPLRDALFRRQAVHIAALDPSCDGAGLGCLDAAIAAASVHNLASRWNKALLDNAARPSGALSYEPGDGSNLSPDQFDRLRAEVERHFAGAGNAGRPLVLDGGMKWQAMALSPADMDFVALKESAARDIALAFGVPPVLVGLPGDSTYANAREAGRALYRQTVLPLAGKILGALGALLGDWLGETRIEIDLDKITELAEDRALLWQQVNAADFLSRAEKRAQLGFDMEGPSDGQ
jgi:HK97 family phage portal protein